MLTFYDGDDLTARVLGQYSGPRGHFKLFTSMADVTIQFQSDPGASVLGYQQGFVIHFFGELAPALSHCLGEGMPNQDPKSWQVREAGAMSLGALIRQGKAGKAPGVTSRQQVLFSVFPEGPGKGGLLVKQERCG